MERKWSGKTDGTSWMHKSLICIIRILPLWLMYLMMSLAIPFYIVFNRKEFIAIYHYFRRRLGKSAVSSFLHAWLNHIVFGMIVMDKFASYAGKKFKVSVVNDKLYEELASGESGFIMYNAHIGNAESGGYSLSPSKRMNILVYGNESAVISGSREQLLKANNIRLIPSTGDMASLITLNNALSDGEILMISADRVFGSPKSVECDFMGAKAEFPAGPFSIAVMRDLPAISIFTVKTSLNSYKIYLDKVDTGKKEENREKRIGTAAASFAANLEKTLKKAPLQWFNFYEFWKN